jgi:hypothetical protein
MIALVLVLITTIGAQNQPASSSSKQPIPISNCGIIDKGGSYVVVGIVATTPSGPCLQITADNVTLHVAGGSVAALFGGLSATSVKNLTIIGPVLLTAWGLASN